MTPADRLARELADLRRRLVALERSAQLTSSTIDDHAGNPVQVSDGILTGIAAEAKAAAALATAASAEAKADAVVTVFYQPTTPTSPALGDFWVNTGNGGKTSTWDGSAWQPLTSQPVADALAAASTAQTTADGKIVTYWQTTAPTTANVGDLWYDTDAGNAVYRWGGSSWVALPVGSAAIADGAVTASKLEADLAVIGAIRSPNYVAGTSGWAVKGDGSADLNAVAMRGSLEARRNHAAIAVGPGGAGGTPFISVNPNDTLYANGGVATSDYSGSRAEMVLYGPSASTGQTPQIIFTSGQSGTAQDGGISLQGNVSTTKDLAVTGNMSATGPITSTFNAQAQSTVAMPTTAAPKGTTSTIVSVTINAVAGRSYEVVARWHAINLGTPVAYPDNKITMGIARNGTSIASKRILAQNTTQAQEGGSIPVTDTPGAGSVTYSLTLNHETGSLAGTAQVNAGTPIQIYVKGFA